MRKIQIICLIPLRKKKQKTNKKQRNINEDTTTKRTTPISVVRGVIEFIKKSKCTSIKFLETSEHLGTTDTLKKVLIYTLNNPSHSYECQYIIVNNNIIITAFPKTIIKNLIENYLNEIFYIEVHTEMKNYLF